MNETLLQVVGRLHPMLLHLPIGVFGALVVLELWGLVRRRPVERGPRLLLVWLLALTAGVSVATGIQLGDEPGYIGPTVDLHRWLGISTASVVALAALLATVGWRRGYAAALFAALMLVVPTGHFGARMKHGVGFLIAPLTSDVATPDASWYEMEIAPILETHCAMCHGATRRKAGLAVDTADAIREARASGVVPDEMLRRVGLPEDHDDHMPPAGKRQLTPTDRATLVAWLEAGGPFDTPLPVDFEAARKPVPVPPAPRELPMDAVANLQAARAHVEIIDPDASLLWIDLSGAPDLAVDDVVALLTPLAPMTRELSLRGVPTASAILAHCGPWPALRHLDVSSTTLDGTGLAALDAAPLVEFTLIGTQLDVDALDALPTLAGVAQINVWGSNIPAARLIALRDALPALVVNDGAVTPPPPLEVEPEFTLGVPVALATLAPVNTTCPVSGTPIDAKFAIVHEGRVVAFCCEKCPVRFWEDPSAFPLDTAEDAN